MRVSSMPWAAVSLGGALSLANGCTCDRQPELDSTRPAQSAEAPKLARKKAVWDPNAEDVVALTEVWNGGGKATSENVGPNVTIRHFDVSPWRLVTTAVYNDKPEAHKLSLEGGPCGPERWAKGVALLEDRGEQSHHEQWYRLSGGPFDGAVVKSFQKRQEGDCFVHLATPEYAKQTDWRYQ